MSITIQHFDVLVAEVICLESGDATHGDIASAETDGMLSPPRADNLSTEMAGHMRHMGTLSARAKRSV